MVIGLIGLVAKYLSERGTGNIPGDGEYSMLSERTITYLSEQCRREHRGAYGVVRSQSLARCRNLTLCSDNGGSRSKLCSR